MIADVPAGLPTPALPGIGLGEIGALSGGALALALVALAESIGAARSLAAKRGYEIDPNQELVALGASNVGAGLLQGFPVDASLSRSAVGAGAGVRTRLSGLFVAVLIVATMLFLTPLFDGLPQATLAAIIIAAVIGLVDVRGFRRLWQIDPGDAQLAIVGFAAVAFLGVLPGIVVAVVASLLALIRRAYRPRIAVLGRATGETSADEDYRFRSIDRHPEYETIPGLVLFRFSNELFFANAAYFRDETLRLVAEADPPARTVLVDASAISHLDTTAVAMLEDLIDRLEAEGVTFELCPDDGRAQRRPRPNRAPRADRARARCTGRCTPGSSPSCGGPAIRLRRRADADVREPSLARLEHANLRRRGVLPNRLLEERGRRVRGKPGWPCIPRWIG